MPLERRTRATLRRAEFGFWGLVVYTRVHTPRRWGEPLSAGVLVLPTLSWRPLRTSWLIVGNLFSVRCWCSVPPGPALGCVIGGALPCTPHTRPRKDRNGLPGERWCQTRGSLAALVTLVR